MPLARTATRETGETDEIMVRFWRPNRSPSTEFSEKMTLSVAPVQLLAIFFLLHPLSSAKMSQDLGPRRSTTSEQKEKEKLDIEKQGRGVTVTDDDEASEVFASFVEGEAGHDIKLRTMTWQKTAVLLFGQPSRSLQIALTPRFRSC
jgi:hypothetical protein